LKVRELIKIAEKRLSEARIEDPYLEARIILAGFLDVPLTIVDTIIEDIPEEKFLELIELRSRGKPIQTIIGRWEFFGRKIFLRDGVFIPRQETEGLVELVLRLIPKEKATVGLEIGVGSGAISCTLLAERDNLFMNATDISAKAIDLARDNALLFGVSDRLVLSKCNLADSISNKLDFIVSNPPYVMSVELGSLPVEVKHDPIEALDGGTDGLRITRKIIEIAPNLLKNGGFIALEIHEELGNEVYKLLDGHFTEKNIFKDLSGKDRYAIAFKEA